MLQKLTILSGLVLSASCMVLHQSPIPQLYGLQYDNPNFNFAYEVNDAHTGDIKSQHESRRGDTVLGQYSLLQPDGVRRTVDYRADDHAGFHASVNNQGTPIGQHVARPADNVHLEASRHGNLGIQAYQQYQHAPATPAPVATSRSSFTQTFSSIHHPWI